MIALTTEQFQELVNSVSREETGGKDATMTDPELYHGERQKLRTFITACELKFGVQERTFRTERSKISYAISRTRGAAWDWASASVQDGRTSYDTWKSFTEALRKAFGEVDSREVARKKLQACRQGNRSASAYWAEFQKYKNDLNYDDQVYIDYFHDGLNYEVQHQLALAGDRPSELIKFVDNAIQLDNRMFNIRSLRPGYNKQHDWTRTQTAQGSAGSTVNKEMSNIAVDPYGPQPMDIDLDATRNSRFGPLTAQERNRRINLKLCLYCGKPGHISRDCRSKNNNQRNYRVSEASFEKEEQGKEGPRE